MGAKPSKRASAATADDAVGAPAQARVPSSASESRNVSNGSGVSDASPSGSDADHGSPTQGRGFNNVRPAKRGGSGGHDGAADRLQNRQTTMVGCKGTEGAEESLDERPFHKEKVNRVPTKALLKPPKNANSVIADPDEDYDLY